MTPDAAIAAARKAGHVVIIHRSEVFFNSWDWDEVQRWEAKGAYIIPHFDLDEIDRRRRRGKHVKPGWEVHILGACERVEVEDTDGDLVDITKDALLLAARAKVPA